MQSIATIALSMCVLISTVATASSSSAKLRRDGVLNLYPFPRVGRAHNTWQVPDEDEYFDSALTPKRQLYAFPRVGRTYLAHNQLPEQYLSNLNHLNIRLEEMLLGHPRSHMKANMKRESKSTSGGMWFGPRIGRSFNNYDDTNNQNESSDRSEPEQTETDRIERKKRQTKQA